MREGNFGEYVIVNMLLIGFVIGIGFTIFAPPIFGFIVKIVMGKCA